MKTIGEYKQKFIDLLVELEKEHQCHVSNVQICHDGTFLQGIGVEMNSFNCEITIE